MKIYSPKLKFYNLIIFGILFNESFYYFILFFDRERNRMNNIPIDTGRDVLDTCLPPSPAERMKRVSSSSSISSLGSSCNLQGLPTIGTVLLALNFSIIKH